MPGICLVGCGSIARTHARNLTGAAALFCYSRSQESAERLAGEYGGQIVPAWNEVLRRPEIDALVICSPPEYHCEQTVEALEAGKSVLVEKPLCVSREEIDRISAAAADWPEPRLMVAENYYYKPLVKLLRWILRLGFLGTLQRMEIRKQYTPAITGWKRGYGALLEGGVHFVALISALAEVSGHQAPDKIESAQPDRVPGSPERRSETLLHYPGGLTATLSYAWNAPALFQGALQHSRIRGDEGSVVFETNGLYSYLWCRQRRRLYIPGLRDLMGTRAMMRDFLASIERPDHQPVSNLHRAARDLEIVFAAYQAASGDGDSPSR